MTPCNPVKPLAICPTCARHSPGIPHDPHFRDQLCMDATTVARDNRCTLHVQRAVPVQWWNREELAA